MVRGDNGTPETEQFRGVVAVDVGPAVVVDDDAVLVLGVEVVTFAADVEEVDGADDEILVTFVNEVAIDGTLISFRFSAVAAGLTRHEMISNVKRNMSDLSNEKATENDMDVTAFVFVNFASSGDVEALESLLKMNPARADTWINFADYDKRTPLHLASEEGHLPVVKLLVERGAQVNVPDRWGG